MVHCVSHNHDYLHKKLVEKLQEQGGLPFHATTLVNILCFHDAWDTFHNPYIWQLVAPPTLFMHFSASFYVGN